MAAAPPRHLVACLEARAGDRLALLRFPPGITLEDAGYDWTSLFHDFPILPADVLGRLPGLGVETVATGPEAVFAALRLANAEGSGADVGSFAEDYLGVNDRLGGGRCVTVSEYAMDTSLGEKPLRAALHDRLLQMGGVRMYGSAAFRTSSLPRVLSLRVTHIALYELRAPRSVRCLLHGDECPNNPLRKHDLGMYRPHEDIYLIVPPQHLYMRVAVPRRLLDILAAARDSWNRRRFARAALAVAWRVLDAIPEDAWRAERRYCPRSWTLASAVAMIAAETCEERAMLVKALRECRSAREMARLARDPSRVVSRALENLGGRR